MERANLYAQQLINSNAFMCSDPRAQHSRYIQNMNLLLNAYRPEPMPHWRLRLPDDIQ